MCFFFKFSSIRGLRHGQMFPTEVPVVLFNSFVLAKGSEMT